MKSYPEDVNNFCVASETTDIIDSGVSDTLEVLIIVGF